jgi:GTP cyclohydrolase IA
MPKVPPYVTHYPTPIAKKPLKLSSQEKITQIAHHFHEIMKLLGLDMDNESLQKTPKRVAEMYVNELFLGLLPEHFPKTHLIDEEGFSDNHVFTKCGFTSVCEHHFVPMEGQVYVSYVSHGKVIGLSKIHRLVRYFAARPQLQERLTQQIADSLAIILGHNDIAVAIQASHFCVIMRGIRDESAETSTTFFNGAFKNASLRDEFFTMMRKQ